MIYHQLELRSYYLVVNVRDVLNKVHFVSEVSLKYPTNNIHGYICSKSAEGNKISTLHVQDDSSRTRLEMSNVSKQKILGPQEYQVTSFVLAGLKISWNAISALQCFVYLLL